MRELGSALRLPLVPAARSTAEEIMIHAKEFGKIKERLNRILIKHTGHPLEKVERDTDRDRFMSAEESLEYGLIDHVVEHIPQAPARPVE